MFEQIKSQFEPNLFLSGGETLSRGLKKSRDQVITRTKIVWQGGRYNATTVFIIGILPIFFHQAKKEQLNSPEQEISRGREKPSEVRASPLPKYFIFINAEVGSPRIHNFHICRDNFLSQIFRHVKSIEFDSILPHDLLYYKVKIWVINYPAIFTRFQRGPRELKKQ